MYRRFNHRRHNVVDDWVSRGVRLGGTLLGSVPPKSPLATSASADGTETSGLRSEDIIKDTELTSADRDLFEHTAIAKRVAELVSRSGSSVHVGVFGTWGSGKSSFLHLLEHSLSEMSIDGRPRDSSSYRRFKVVWYDAWRFSGSALRRDFIAAAARELKVSNSSYSTGLFESRQVVKLDFDELARRVVEFIKGILALIIAICLTVLVAGLLLSLLNSTTSIDLTTAQVIETVRPQGPKVIAVAGALIAALNLPRLVGVSVSRSSPSQDDEFTQKLQDLVVHAELPWMLRVLRLNKKIAAAAAERFGHRVVFFIDELDRSTDEELVSTLTALQTMLSTVKVTAILAVDKAVVQSAMTAGRHQAGPDRAMDPYLSTDAAFLDKIFQHQFNLPPLRPERVQSFAKDLVKDRGGLWGQLAKSGLLDDVIYLLVPAHVRNPRRIKVIMNAFATQFRVAESRGIDVGNLAKELAQWVVLQLEFPNFSRDLLQEPSLSSLLSSETTIGLTQIQQRLVAQHSRRSAPDAAASERDWKDWVESDQLHRYLERTSHVPALTRSLLYLELAGSAVGQFKPEVAEALDNAGDREPSTTVEELAALSVEETDAALLFLGERCRSAISEGSDRFITVICLLAESHPSAALGSLAALVEALRSYNFTSSARPLPAAAMPGALRILSEAGETDWLERAVDAAATVPGLGNDVLLRGRLPSTEADWEVIVAGLQGALDDELLLALQEADQWPVVRAAAATCPDVLVSALANVSDEEQVDALVGHVVEFPSQLVSKIVTSTIDLFDDVPDVPYIAQSLGDALLDSFETSRLAIAAIPASPGDELTEWTSRITMEVEDDTVPAAISALIVAYWSVEDVDELAVEMTRLVQCGYGEIATSLQDSLGGAPLTAAQLENRLKKGLAAIRICGAYGAGTACEVAKAEALRFVAPLVAGQLTWADCNELYGSLTIGDVAEVDEAISDACRGESVTVMARAMTVRLRLRSRFESAGLEAIRGRHVGAAYKDERATSASQSVSCRMLMGAFFDSNPTDRDLMGFLRASGRYAPAELEKWGARHSPAQVTNVWLTLFDYGFPATAGGNVAAKQQLSVAKAARALESRMQAGGAESRSRSRLFVRSLGPRRPDSGSLGQLVAVELAKAGGAERAAAIRLLTDVDPAVIRQETKDVLRAIPKSMWKRKADKEMGVRVGVPGLKRGRKAPFGWRG